MEVHQNWNIGGCRTRIPEPLQVLSATAIVELSICTEVDALGPPLAKDCAELNAVTSFCGITCDIFAESTHARLFCAEIKNKIIYTKWKKDEINAPVDGLAACLVYMQYEEPVLKNRAKYLKASIAVDGGSRGGFVREGGGQAVLVANTLLFVLSDFRNFNIKSCIVCPSG
ncbi:hypothetical protein ALC60_10090 [Trachymyrmex zeteki]|uniref:Uncharacterized protein n=1 Tax=Mycetomoellerius zeteki TaxID=64791 RepID=A0A151WSU4_9HYME|nr:hypothetical protein ALC60_10090 [Trachymyrmex zeteki]